MSDLKVLERTLPVAPLKIAALESCTELGEKVNDYIVQFRKDTSKEAHLSFLPTRWTTT